MFFKDCLFGGLQNCDCDIHRMCLVFASEKKNFSHSVSTLDSTFAITGNALFNALL